MSRVTLVFTLLISLVLSACASVPMTGAEEDHEAKLFKAPNDKARLYIYRNESYGFAIKVGLTVDGKMIGKTAQDTFFAIDLSPGRHVVECQAETDHQVTVDLKKGEVAFLWQEMKSGVWSARCKLNPVDEATGRKGVAECKRAAVRIY